MKYLRFFQPFSSSPTEGGGFFKRDFACEVCVLGKRILLGPLGKKSEASVSGSHRTTIPPSDFADTSCASADVQTLG